MALEFVRTLWTISIWRCHIDAFNVSDRQDEGIRSHYCPPLVLPGAGSTGRAGSTDTPWPSAASVFWRLLVGLSFCKHDACSCKCCLFFLPISLVFLTLSAACEFTQTNTHIYIHCHDHVVVATTAVDMASTLAPLLTLNQRSALVCNNMIDQKANE